MAIGYARLRESKVVKKYMICLLLLSMVPFLCSFSGLARSKTLSNNKKQKRIEYWGKTLQRHAEKKNWAQFDALAIKASKDGFHSNKFKKLAAEVKNPILLKAVVASQEMKKLSSDLGISFAELLKISLFIETKMAHKVKQKGNYLGRSETGLARSVEYDPETKSTFIHLHTHGTSQIGKGRKKVVTKSILYHPTRPELLAHCSTKIPMPKEIIALQKLQGLPGIVETKAFTSRKDNHGTPIYGVLCNYYREGDLEQFLKNRKIGLSINRKMKIAADILQGLESMHKNGYVHRDLNIKNYLINVEKGKKGGTKIKAVIADLGRAIPIEKVKGEMVQWNSSYTAPEGILRKNLEGKDYTYSDIYAVGCAFYNLLTGKRAPWINKKWIKGTDRSAKFRYAEYIRSLRLFQRKTAIETHSRRNPKARFKRLIATMCNPVPKKRGTAHKLRQALGRIMRDSKKRK